MGARMVRVLEAKDGTDRFCDMSLEFAEFVNVITPRMRQLIERYHNAGIRCGVALFGETVFALVPSQRAGEARRLAADAGAIAIQSGLDGGGARCIRAVQV